VSWQIRVRVRGFLAWILDIRIEDVIFWSAGVVKEIPGRVKKQGNRGLFFFNHVFVVKYKKLHGELVMAETKLCKQSNGPLHLVMGQTNTPHP